MKTALVVMALCLGSISNVYAGWIFSGYCYATSAEALSAFQKQYPIIDQSGNYTSFVTASVNASGLLSYTLNNRPITSSITTSRTGTMQLSSCSKPDDFSLSAALEAFAFFFSTTIFFYAVGRGAGAVLEAIRSPLGRY